MVSAKRVPATGPAKTKIIVSAPPEVRTRLEALLKAVETCITPTASRAMDRSTICLQAINDLLDKYESDPAGLAAKLGFSTRTLP